MFHVKHRRSKSEKGKLPHAAHRGRLCATRFKKRNRSCIVRNDSRKAADIRFLSENAFEWEARLYASQTRMRQATQIEESGAAANGTRPAEGVLQENRVSYSSKDVLRTAPAADKPPDGRPASGRSKAALPAVKRRRNCPPGRLRQAPARHSTGRSAPR